MSDVKFIADGNTISVFELNENTSSDTLKNQIYQVSFHQMRGYYLTVFDKKFDNGRLFGNVENRADRIIDTYKQRDQSTGVLLTGSKGSGKSLLTKVIANKLIDSGLPVILINEPHSGSAFEKFLSLIGDCVVIFDEFAKVYSVRGNDEDVSVQKDLLTLFDGMTNRKRLVLFTENELYRIDDHLLNRPGRIFYHFEYSKLDQDSIKEYCEYREIDEKMTEDIITYSKTADEFSFDVLTAIIEEYVRYAEPIGKIIKHLNISNNRSEYNIFINECTNLNSKAKYEPIKAIQTVSDLEQFRLSFCVQKNLPDPNSEEALFSETQQDGSRVHRYWFSKKDIVYETGNQYVYETDDDMRLVCTIEPKKYDFAYDTLF